MKFIFLHKIFFIISTFFPFPVHASSGLTDAGCCTDGAPAVAHAVFLVDGPPLSDGEALGDAGALADAPFLAGAPCPADAAPLAVVAAVADAQPLPVTPPSAACLHFEAEGKCLPVLGSLAASVATHALSELVVAAVAVDAVEFALHVLLLVEPSPAVFSNP
jgi:hypothetical protein